MAETVKDRFEVQNRYFSLPDGTVREEVWIAGRLVIEHYLYRAPFVQYDWVWRGFCAAPKPAALVKEGPKAMVKYESQHI